MKKPVNLWGKINIAVEKLIYKILQLFTWTFRYVEIGLFRKKSNENISLKHRQTKLSVWSRYPNQQCGHSHLRNGKDVHLVWYGNLDNGFKKGKSFNSRLLVVMYRASAGQNKNPT